MPYTETIVAYSDCLDVQEDHRDTRLISYTNNHDYAGIEYDGDYPPTFFIRVESKFYVPRSPQEDESESISDGTVVKLSSSTKRQRLMEFEPMPPYMHDKLPLIFNHNSLFIGNKAWVKEESYEIDVLNEKYALFGATIYLTLANSNATSNVS